MYIYVCVDNIRSRLSCETLLIARRPPKLSIWHRPVTHAFQCVAVDLVEFFLSLLCCVSLPSSPINIQNIPNKAVWCFSSPFLRQRSRGIICAGLERRRLHYSSWSEIGWTSSRFLR